MRQPSLMQRVIMKGELEGDGVGCAARFCDFLRWQVAAGQGYTGLQALQPWRLSPERDFQLRFRGKGARCLG